MREYVDVFKRPRVFAGWPANHGGWQWGDEFLVGFMIGEHGVGLHHEIMMPFVKMQARSLDGGKTWKVEQPNLPFNGTNPTVPPEFNLWEENTIIRVCGTYDTGGEDCDPNGAFYLSENQGQYWRGPYHFTPVIADDDEHNTSRTCYLQGRNTLYLTYAKKAQWGSDFIVELYHSGREFIITNIVHMDEHRTVMPSLIYMPGRDRHVMVARRKGGGKNWIDAFVRTGSEPWKPSPSNPVADTGVANGNPPALALVGDTICCAYGNRLSRTIEVKYSHNGGESWSNPTIIDQSINRDLGYPKLFVREDGKLVCVYYIANDLGSPCHIQACIFDPE